MVKFFCSVRDSSLLKPLLRYCGILVNQKINHTLFSGHEFHKRMKQENVLGPILDFSLIVVPGSESNNEYKPLVIESIC